MLAFMFFLNPQLPFKKTAITNAWELMTMG